MISIVRPDYTPRLAAPHPTPRLSAGPGELTIGVLHNRKHNADVLMTRLADNLARDLGGRVISVAGKDHAAIPAPDELMHAAAAAHVILTGSAD